MSLIDISKKLKQMGEDGEWHGEENPADCLRNRDTNELIEIQDRLVDEMNEPHTPEIVSMLSIIQAELLSRGEIGFRT